MRTYTCDGCKQPLEPPVYELRTMFQTTGLDGTREGHFHWECLKKYMNWA